MNVIVEHKKLGGTYETDGAITKLYEKFGDRLIDWKVSSVKWDEHYLWYVLKHEDDIVEPKEPIKI